MAGALRVDLRAARPRPARVRARRLRRRRPAARQRGRRADGLVPGDRAAVAGPAVRARRPRRRLPQRVRADADPAHAPRSPATRSRETSTSSSGRAREWMDGAGHRRRPTSTSTSSPTCATAARATRSRSPLGRRCERRSTSASTRCTSSSTASACPTRRRRSSTCARSAPATGPEPELPRGRTPRVVESTLVEAGTLRRAPTSHPGRAASRVPSIVTEFDSTTVVLAGLHRRGRPPLQPADPTRRRRDGRAPQKIAEIPDLEVDPITLDIIENALRHARFEMDAVLFRSRDVARSSASSTTSSRCSPTRGPDGRRPVRRLHQRDDGRLGSRHLPGRRDPHAPTRTSAAASISPHQRLARARADLLRGRARRLVLAVRPPDGRRRARCPGSLPTGATTIFEEGIIIPPLKIVERGEVQRGRPRT